MRIALLGGTFDPFTSAHLEMAERTLQESDIEKVVIVPTVVVSHREYKEPWLSYEQRTRVIKETVDRSVCREHIEIDCREYMNIETVPPPLRRAEISSRRFLHTLVALKASHPDDELFLILGTDQARGFDAWFEYGTIAEIVSGFVVFNGRDGANIEIMPPCISRRLYAILEIGESNRYVSASQIRRDFSRLGVDYYIRHFGEQLLVRTPIFDVVSKPEVSKGFCPVGINAPDWASVIIRSGDRFLTVSQLRYGTMYDVEEFVCGQVEPGEMPVDAAVREVAEETGFSIAAKDVVPLGWTYPNPAFMGNKMFFFLVDVGDQVAGEQHPDEHEKLELEWRTYEEINQIAVTALMEACLRRYDHHVACAMKGAAS